MTNETDTWRERFEKGRREQWNGGDPYWPDWEGIEDFIARELAAAREDERRKVVEMLVSLKHYDSFLPDYVLVDDILALTNKQENV